MTKPVMLLGVWSVALAGSVAFWWALLTLFGPGFGLVALALAALIASAGVVLDRRGWKADHPDDGPGGCPPSSGY